MIKFFTFLIACNFAFMLQAKAQVVYATKANGGGAWSATATWETFSSFAAALAASPGTGTAATTVPSGTHNVLIRSNDVVTMADANRGCKGIIIQAGAKLWGSGNTADRRLQIGQGGTGFTYPLVDTVQVDGTLGGANDPMFIETGINAQQVKIYGNGSIDVKRLRIIGASGSASGGALTMDIDINMNLWQAANYAFSAVYNPAATDNYTVNIGASKTIAIRTADGYFHNNAIGSGSGFGNYTYNINGTIDLSASAQTLTNLTAFSPTGGTVNVNVKSGGLIKTGAAFNSSPVAPGVANLTIENNALVDATLATVMNFNNNKFVVQGSGLLRRTVLGDGSRSLFPVANSGAGLSNAQISRLNTSGTIAVYSLNVKSTFDNPPVAPAECVTRQWNFSITGSPSANDTMRLSWITADQGGSFNPAGTVSIMHWTGAAWEYFPATVTGTGTAADPYVARATQISSYSPFGVTSYAPTPVSLVAFNAVYNRQGITLNWTTENEVNLKQYVVEKSFDGRNYTAIAQVAARNTTTINQYQHADNAFLSGTAYYRLKMTDNDGTAKYSHVVTVNAKLSGSIKIYPNPVADFLNVQLPASAGKISLQVIDAAGKLVQQSTVPANTAYTFLPVSTLVKGNYRLLVITANERLCIPFVK